MAKSYNLTAQLNLQGPANLKSVSGKIKKELSGAAGSLEIKIDKRSLASIDAATKKTIALSKALRASGGAAGALNQQLRRLNTQVAVLGKRSTIANKQFTKMDRGLKTITRDTKKAGKQVRSLTKDIKANLLQATRYSIAAKGLNLFTSAINDAATKFLDFERNLNRVAIITGKSVSSLSGLSSTIRKTAKDFGASSAELSDVTLILTQSGLAADKVRKSIEALGRASLSPTFTDMRNAAEGAIAVFSQFGVAAEDLGVVLASMDKLSSNFAVEFNDLVVAVQKGGGAFQAAAKQGDKATVSLNKFNALFTTIRSTTRESADTIGTGLRTITARLQKLSTQGNLNDILGGGIDLYKNGDFIGTYEAIGEISKRLKELGITAGDPRFAAVAEQIGGIRQISRVIPLLQQAEKTQRAFNTAQAAGAQSDADAAKAKQTLANQIARTYEAFQDMVSAFANNSFLKGTVSLVLSLTRGLFGLAKAFAPLTPLLLMFAGGKIAKGVGGLLKGTSGGGLGSFFSGKQGKDTATTSNTAALNKLTKSIDALRSKGAGTAQGFARGGVVPGTGNRDTVPAMLTPGEFVIRKDAVKALGTEKLHQMNKYAKGGRIANTNAVGVVSIYDRKSDPFTESSSVLTETIDKKLITKQFKKSPEDQARLQESIVDGKTYEYVGQPLSSVGLGSKIEEGLNKGIIEGVENSVSIIGNTLASVGLPSNGIKIGQASQANFLKSINEGVLGNLFEQVLATVKDQGSFTGVSNPQAPFDFENGIGNLSALFPAIGSTSFVDAKANLQAGLPDTIARKVGNEYLNNIKAEEQQDMLQSLRNKIDFGGNGLSQKKLIEQVRGITSLGEAAAKSRIQSLVDSGEINKRENPNGQGFIFTSRAAAQTAANGGFIQKLMAGGYASSKPPSPKQLGFLKKLVEENGVPEGFEYPPKTSAQASALIDRIKNPPKQGLNLNNLFKEYQQIFGMAHPQANDIEDYNEQDLRNLTQSVDKTIDKYDKFANIIKEYYGRIIHQDSWNGSFYALGGPNPMRPNKAQLDQFVNGGFDRNLLEEFGKRGDAAFGSSVNAQTRSKNALRTRKSYMRGYAEGGSIEDTVPALLTPGEFVINKESAAKIGAANLNKLNKADKIQGFNKGGPVGFIQRFAEGGSAQSLNSQIAVSTAEVKNLAAAQAAAEQEYLGLAARLKSMDDSLVAGIEGNKAYKRAVDIKIQLEQKLLAAEEAAIAVMEEYQAAEKERTALISQAKAVKEEKKQEQASKATGQQGTVTEGLANIDNIANSMKAAADEMAKRIQVAAEVSQQIFENAAKNAGMSLEDFSTSIRDASKETVSQIYDSMKTNRANLQTGLLKGIGSGLKTQDQQNEFRSNAAENIGAILGSGVSSDRLQEIVNGLEAAAQSGTSSLVDMAAKFPELGDALDESSDLQRANVQAQEQIAQQYGAITAEMKLTEDELKSIDFSKSEDSKNLFGVGKLADAFSGITGIGGGAEGFAKTKIGQKFIGANKALGKDPVAGFLKSQASKFKLPGLGKMVGSISKATKAFGGLTGAIGIASNALADNIDPSSASTAEGAAGLGALKGGIGGAATGAGYGAIFGPVGAAIGAAIGGLTGAISGAIKALNAKRLEIATQNLSKTMADLDENIRDLERSNSSIDFESGLSKATSNLSSSFTNIAEIQSQARIGARQSSIWNLWTGKGDTANEATSNLLSELPRLIEQTEKVALQEGKKISIAESEANIQKIQSGDLSGSTFMKTLLASNGGNERAAYESLGITRAAAKGQDVDKLKRENPEELIRLGKEEASVRARLVEEQIKSQKQQQQARAEAESLVAAFKKVTAGFERLNSVIDDSDKQLQETIDNLKGAGKIERTSKLDVAALKNNIGFSQQEVAASAQKAGTIIGGERGAQVEAAVNAKRVLDAELPNILAKAEPGNTDAVIDKVSNVLSGTGISDDLRRSITQSLAAGIDRRTGGGENTVSFADLSNETDGLIDSLSVLDAQNAAAVAALETFNRAVDTAAQRAEMLIDALEQVRQREVQGIQNRINAENSIAEAMGKRVTLEEKNASFFAEFDSLAPGTRNGNDIDIDAIVQRREAIATERQGLSDRRASSTDLGEIQNLTEQMADLGSEDQKLVKSLELVANSNDLLNNALGKYREQVAQENKKIGFADRLATGTPEDLAQIAMQTSATNVALSSDAGTQKQFFANRENRANALAGLESLDFLGTDDRTRQQLEAKTRLSVYENTPGMKQFLDMKTQDVNGNETSLREILERRAKGELTPEEQAAKDAAKLQAEANKALVEMDTKIADAIRSSISDSFGGELDPVVVATNEVRDAVVDLHTDMSSGNLSGPSTNFSSTTGPSTSTAPPEEVTTVDRARTYGQLGIAARGADVAFNGGRTGQQIYGAAQSQLRPLTTGYSRAREAGMGIRQSIQRGVQGQVQSMTRGGAGRAVDAVRSRLPANRYDALKRTQRFVSNVRSKLPTPNQAGLKVGQFVDDGIAKIPGAANRLGRAYGRTRQFVGGAKNAVQSAPGRVVDGLKSLRSLPQATKNLVQATKSSANVAKTINATRNVAGAARGAAPGMLAANTVLSAGLNAAEFAYDPAAYNDKMVARVQAGMDEMYAKGEYQFTSLGGALEGLSDPIGKIVEGGYALKGLADDMSKLGEQEAIYQNRQQTQGEMLSAQRGKEIGGTGTFAESEKLDIPLKTKVQEIARQEQNLRLLEEKIASGQGTADDEKKAGILRTTIDRSQQELQASVKAAATNTGAFDFGWFYDNINEEMQRNIQDQVNRALSQERVYYEKQANSGELTKSAKDTMAPAMDVQAAATATSMIPTYPDALVPENQTLVEEMMGLTSSMEGLSSVFVDVIGPSIAEAISNTVITAEFSKESAGLLGGFNYDFGRYVKQLSEIKIPENITLQATHTVSVTINGAEVLQELSEPLQKMVLKQVNLELNRITDGGLGSAVT